jgi:hypothetical protein
MMVCRFKRTGVGANIADCQQRSDQRRSETREMPHIFAPIDWR